MANKAKDVKNRPAGINDEIDIAVMDINNIVEKGKIKLIANGSKKVSALSNELSMGMSIKAYDGGKAEKISVEER